MLPLVLEFLVVPPHHVTSDVSLEEGQDSRQTLFTELLKHTEDTSSEEHLGVAQLVFVSIKLKSLKNLTRGFLGLNESLWDSIGRQDGVTEMNLRDV